MSNFVRREDLEQQVEDTYSLKVEVYRKSINRDSYEIKLVKGIQEVLLREVMSHGNTKFVTMVWGGITKNYTEYHKAEEDAINLLRS
jgi:hypothetical protein